ncbi:bifunctional diaminohydroxyphosphoribosylaminopyrimidine deaminase/5-amino-6-(5-phosphoribosylamino)uracil reductase RibD [Hydrogenivirga sp. 128-5-R1-1]|uniref:bifunctional diaminohydroxyphosphoribosylaminopyrimidine deaminase/5-amino-6-(5-phosphoribosylamino)uracil reductase RibD n=1 Tax=Hydrogenivirga sp. 128-5-R1-1 TaxID=392423 RepID=UPI00015EF93E|nr:bifunctional diaminohydroxyphosphoribosylaminopyrimidine deaminase/5-amino-6-(5-phosphoribosylamino)uracil reductase RibD [Hydrogenivirga sp. 128-5-R1-1]EDP75259.1 riboflavin specific deaminase [Hydrogenivirga sp. 128-5-R1-1]
MSDVGYMSLALSLAKRRKGLTHPNPTVGCVVVNEGEIVGLGYHEGAGHPHAEVVALEQAGEKAKGSTLYVTLEPCTHFGRTPPCTDALIRAGIRKAVVAVKDPNPVVGGKGIERLREAGLDVEVGVLEEEARELNEDFFTFITMKRPYVTLKLAQTLDGKVATPSGDSKWISSPESRRFAHRLRSEATAVLVGLNTFLRDNPSLTIRHIPFGRQPLRIVIDPELEIPMDSNLVSDGMAQTLVVFSRRDPAKESELLGAGVQLLYMEKIELGELLKELASRDVLHLLVEGGAYTVSQFLKEGLWDRLVVFQAPRVMGDGISLSGLGVDRVNDCLKLKIRREHALGEDRVFEYVPVMESPGLRW